jgi:hypothetical protein
MVEDEHVRITHITVFPFTPLSSEILIKPSPIPQSVFAGASVVATRISLVIFVINSLFAGAAIRLQSIFSG